MAFATVINIFPSVSEKIKKYLTGGISRVTGLHYID
jgi:hypothetical protein